MENLKPCPFCGGKPKYIRDHTTENVDEIVCQGCWTSMSDHDEQGSCIRAWNRRRPEKSNLIEHSGEFILNTLKNAQAITNAYETPKTYNQLCESIERMKVILDEYTHPDFIEYVRDFLDAQSLHAKKVNDYQTIDITKYLERLVDCDVSLRSKCALKVEKGVKP